MVGKNAFAEGNGGGESHSRTVTEEQLKGLFLVATHESLAVITAEKQDFMDFCMSKGEASRWTSMAWRQLIELYDFKMHPAHYAHWGIYSPLCKDLAIRFTDAPESHEEAWTYEEKEGIGGLDVVSLQETVRQIEEIKTITGTEAESFTEFLRKRRMTDRVLGAYRDFSNDCLALPRDDYEI